MGVIKIEGKSVTLDDAIIDAGIPAIKAALSVDFPDTENADIEIIGSKAPGVVRSATVVKRGTGKGNEFAVSSQQSAAGNAQRDVLEALLAAPEFVNPAIALARECQAAETAGDQEVIERAIRSGAMEHAIEEGEREGLAVMKSLASCGHSPPVASKTVPVGF